MRLAMGFASRFFLSRIALSLTLALLTFLVVAETADAQSARARDRVQGDFYTVEWSEGTWTQSAIPVPGCLTFPGGVATGPGSTAHADSIICQAVPNGWHWTVTIPGPYTIHWDSNNFPVGVELCAQIFYSPFFGAINAAVDLDDDWLVVRRDANQQILYEGPWSSFVPDQEGFVVVEARRCGKVVLLPTGACCDLSTGSCTILTQEECNQQPYPHEYQGNGTVCEPNPCPPPPPPTGACCFEDGTCTVLTAEECSVQGGVYQGDEVACEPNPCPPPPPTGACCFWDGSCLLLTEAQCLEAEGAFQGPGTSCDPNLCEQPVPTDRSSWGQIKVRYR